MEEPIQLALAQHLARLAGLAPAELERAAQGDVPAVVALERAGRIGAAHWRKAYALVRETLESKNVFHDRDAADRALLRLAVRSELLTHEAARAAIDRWQARSAFQRPRLADAVVDEGVLAPELKARLADRVAREQVACPICGRHIDRLALEPDLACPRCGWPDLANARGTDTLAAIWTDRIIGGWTLLDRVGTGGFGRVYKATHPTKGVGAFKVLHPRLAADPSWRARFAREAHAVGLIDHPNCVKLLDSGHDEELPFLVMEWIDGESLHQRLARVVALDVKEAIRVARELAGALGAVHDAGLVHRDVKPENVLLTRHDRAVLADFGLVREAEIAGQQAASGPRIGSPGYISPEHVRGEPLDRRTDLFSLGMVCHAMITGRNPLLREKVQLTLAATLNEDVPPLDHPDAPPELVELVRAMTARDRVHRPGTMGDVKDVLDRLAWEDTLAARRPPSLSRIARPKSGRGVAVADPASEATVASDWIPRRPAAGISIVTALAIVGLGLGARYLWRASGRLAEPKVYDDPALPSEPLDEQRRAAAVVEATFRQVVDGRDETSARWERWNAAERAAIEPSRSLYAARRDLVLARLAQQAQAEVALLGPLVDTSIEHARFQEARERAQKLPAFTVELARVRSERLLAVDVAQYRHLLARAVALVADEPDRARALLATLERDAGVLAQLQEDRASDSPVASLKDLARVVQACERYLDALERPCSLEVAHVDGKLYRVTLEYFASVKDPSCEAAWGRDIGARHDGKRVGIPYRDVTREQKARWAVAVLARERAPEVEQRRLIGLYLTATGTPPAELPKALGRVFAQR